MMSLAQQQEEILRALSSPDPVESLKALDSRGVLLEILPELAPAKGAEQPPEHFWDVFDHLLETVGSVDAVLADPILWSTSFPLSSYTKETPCGNLSRLTLLKLAALFHDVAKPQTKTREATGKFRFFGHPEIGAETAGKILSRLQFPPDEIVRVQTMILHHLRPGVLAYKEEPTDRALLRYFRDLDDVAIDTLLLNLADHRAMRGPMMAEEEWIEHLEVVRSILDRHGRLSSIKPERLIGGDELMNELGLAPGPVVGDLLEVIWQAQLRGTVKTKEEAVALARKSLPRS